MNINHLPDMARRAFLKRSTALGVTGALAPWATQLSMIGEASAAQSSSDDYKALVCIFFYGGNDFANMLIPFDNDHYAQYANIRSGLSIPQEQLTSTVLDSQIPLEEGAQFALAPEMQPLKAIWDAGHLAVQLNVGTLIMPTSMDDYRNRRVMLPVDLFSHNSQTSMWQSGISGAATKGWGGRMGDLLLSSNSNSLFTNISINGNVTFLAGETIAQYQVSSGGAIAIRGALAPIFGSPACQNTLRSIISQNDTSFLGEEYSRITQSALDGYSTLSAGLQGIPTLNTTFDPKNKLASQLKMVANLIAARSSLGVKRQVFLVGMGGFDLHDNLVSEQPKLLSNVANAMRSFYDATVELGVAQNVTSFTASDFGRTLTSNGDGADHGWGSHHFVMGGAVRGQRFYGKAPDLALNGRDDIVRGVFLPSTSVDQYAATMVDWMGVSSSNMSWVIPNIGNYSDINLGFV